VAEEHADLKLAGVHRREAQSGRSSFSDPVVIYEGQKKRVLFVPFFIPRSAGVVDGEGGNGWYIDLAPDGTIISFGAR
jgi:hypothetical protein